MIILKIVGAVIVSLSGVGLASLLCASSRAAVTQTEGLCALARYLGGEISCFCMPIPTALSRCPWEILKKCGADARVRYQSVEELLDACGIYDARTREITSAFAREIGRGYRAEQIALCERTAQMLSQHAQELLARLPTKQRLSGTLSVCSALAAVILLV